MTDQIVENERPKDQDPKALNSQLRNFYLNVPQLIPPSVLPRSLLESVFGKTNSRPTTEEIWKIWREGLESIDRRSKNEVTDKLGKRLKVLLEPANSTQAMKDCIESAFYNILLFGDWSQDYDLPEWVDHEGNTGIYDFDKQKVKPIERSVYRAYLKVALMEKGFEDAQSEFMNRPSRAVQDRHLPGWRAEFIERYGEEP